jgi:hypothetical protein
MRKVIKIGDIVLDHPLFIKEEFDVKNVQGTAFDTIGGGKVVFESVKRHNANYYTLTSFENGWLKEDTVRKIIMLADNIGVETTITFDSGSTANVRFAYEKGQIVKAEPIFENSEWFKVEVFLCEV